MEIQDVHALLGRTAYDVDGDRLGTITGAYVDDTTGRPSWMTVERGGLFRSSRNFVPLDGAEVVADGVRLGVSAEAVRRAPHVDDDRVLTRADEQELLRHYGFDAPTADAPPDVTQDPSGDATREPSADPVPGAMTRSEERVRVGTTTVATSRAVLRTTRVVEDRTFSVPLGRDQVQVVYEPLPVQGTGTVQGTVRAADEPDREPDRGPDRGPRDDSRAEPTDERDDGWVVLYEERLVVRTEWVPVERVRLGTAAVQGQEVLDVDLRRERIDVDVEPAVDARAQGRTAAPGDHAARA